MGQAAAGEGEADAAVCGQLAAKVFRWLVIRTGEAGSVGELCGWSRTGQAEAVGFLLTGPTTRHAQPNFPRVAERCVRSRIAAYPCSIDMVARTGKHIARIVQSELNS